MLVMLTLCQHHSSESKVWDLCGLRPHNLLIDCNPVLSTELTGPHYVSLTMLSYIELSFQAPSYDHILLPRVHTLTECFSKKSWQLQVGAARIFLHQFRVLPL